MFQSAPGFGAGGNGRRRTRGGVSRRFQSAPGFGAGGNHHDPRLDQAPKSFNPPPALGPGETGGPLDRSRKRSVSIRPRLWGRGKLDVYDAIVDSLKFQSAPGFGAGGNMFDAILFRNTAGVSIRPRLWGRGKPKPLSAS